MKDENKEWNENVRTFIEFHDDILDSIDENQDTKFGENDEDDNIIKEHGYNYFVGDMCADIDEDEFDGPNDLEMEEWEKLDDIILYYYNKV
jgi:hypothetical protein